MTSCHVHPKADLDVPLRDGCTALFVAAKKGNHQAVMELLERGSRINHKTNKGTTPFHVACNSGRRGCVLALLAYGADAATVNKSGKAPKDTCNFDDIRGMLAATQSNPNSMAIAAALRLPSAMQFVLRNAAEDAGVPEILQAVGASHDPAAVFCHALAELVSVHTPRPGGWVNHCAETKRIARLAMVGWAPYSHHLFHRGVSVRVSLAT